MAILRQIRSTVTLGVLWGLGWSVAGAALGAYRLLFVAPHFENALHLLPRFILIGGAAFGICGAVAGISFAAMIVRAGRRHTLEEFTTRSVALWGAVAGIALPGAALLIAAAGGAPIVEAAAFIGIAATVGAGVGALSAVATLKLARRAPLGSGDRRDLLATPL